MSHWNYRVIENKIVLIDGEQLSSYMTDSAMELSRKLLEQGALSKKATDDALHIALTSVHNIDYLMIWNCRHIDNAETKPIIRSVIISNDYFYPEICTPQKLMGVELDEE